MDITSSDDANWMYESREDDLKEQMFKRTNGVAGTSSWENDRLDTFSSVSSQLSKTIGLYRIPSAGDDVGVPDEELEGE